MKIQNILRDAWKKATPERIELFNYMDKKHIFTANDITENFSNIGRASIFRTIKLFVEIWVLRRVHIGDGAENYEIQHSHNHHEHMACNVCGSIISIASESICKKIFSEAKKIGFQIQEHSVNIFGTCSNCNLIK